MPSLPLEAVTRALATLPPDARHPAATVEIAEGEHGEGVCLVVNSPACDVCLEWCDNGKGWSAVA